MEFNDNFTWTEENMTLEEDYENTTYAEAGNILRQIL